MEELDLCKILKGHENELFYSPIFGEVYLNAIFQSQLYPISLLAEKGHEIYINRNGFWDNKYTENTIVVLYPSQEAYLKYPFDAKKAWQEWVDEQKPKRWRAKLGCEYWYINECGSVDDIMDDYSYYHDFRYEMGNYFSTREFAKQAVETLKATLEQFHQNNESNSKRNP